jgi:hypothetical protein
MSQSKGWLFSCLMFASEMPSESDRIAWHELFLAMAKAWDYLSSVWLWFASSSSFLDQILMIAHMLA